MDADRPLASRMRLFVAIGLPDTARAATSRVASRLRASPAIRATSIAWVPRDRYHLTLAFLGEVSPPTLRSLLEVAVRPLPLPPPPIELTRLGQFPARGVPRVIWLGMPAAADGPVADVHQRLWRRLEPLGAFGPPSRFHPHVTLGRVRRAAGVAAGRRVAGPVDPPVRWTATHVTVYESRAVPGGVTYIEHARSPFAGP